MLLYIIILMNQAHVMNYAKNVITYSFRYQVRFKVPGTQSVVFVQMVWCFILQV